MPQHTPAAHRVHAGRKTGRRTRAPAEGTGYLSLFDLLTQEHAAVKCLFDDIAGETAEEREKLFLQLESRLKMHLEKEEQFVYPLLEHSSEALVLVLKSYEEHKTAKRILGEFEDLLPESAEWEAKFMVLRHLVTNHLDSEEQELFPPAKRELDESRMRKAVRSIRNFERSATR